MGACSGSHHHPCCLAVVFLTVDCCLLLLGRGIEEPVPVVCGGCLAALLAVMDTLRE